MEQKKELRRLIREEKGRRTAGWLEACSHATMARLEAHPRFKAARVVLMYHALPDEVDTREILQRYAGSKTLLLPVVDGDTLRLRRYEGAGTLHEGAFRIQEPEGMDFTDYARIDLTVIPGMAFDAAGHRLGRGRGYYDRLFAEPALARAYRLGICFPFQRVDGVPVCAHDVCMHEVLALEACEAETFG